MDIDIKSLSFSAIRGIDDLDLLQHIREQLDVDIEHISASLEFSTDEQTVDWEKRAVFALANKRAVRAAVIRKLDASAFKARHDAAQLGLIDQLRAKIAKLEDDKAAENQRHNLEVQRLSVERLRLKYEIQASRDAHFSQLAGQFLTPEQRIMCGQEAERRAAAVVRRVEIGEAA